MKTNRIEINILGKELIMAILLPLIFFVMSCMDWSGWWSNVTPDGRATLFVIGLFAASFIIGGFSGINSKR